MTRRGLIFPNCVQEVQTFFTSLLKRSGGGVLAVLNHIPLSKHRRLRWSFGSKLATA